MAPRSAKAKKTADVKVAENEAPKKGRGKTKIIEEPELEYAEPEIKEKVIPTSDKKAKRGKKATSDTNGQEEANGAGEDIAPPAKKGKKKNNEESLDEKLEIQEDSPTPEETKQNGDTESEPAQSSAGKGRKKQGKKENAQEKPKESGKGKKNTKQGKPEIEVIEKIETSEDKPKSAGKGRGRKAQPKTDKEIEQEEEIEEEVKPDPPASKGKKKSAKSTKAADNDQEDIAEDLDEKSVEEIKKGKKTQGKKNVTKEETEAEEARDEVQNIKKRKTAKKEKGKGDTKDDEVIEDESSEPKPGKGKRGQKKAAEAVEIDEDPLETEEPSSKRRRKPAEEKGN